MSKHITGKQHYMAGQNDMTANWSIHSIMLLDQWCSNTQIRICKYSMQYHFHQIVFGFGLYLRFQNKIVFGLYLRNLGYWIYICLYFGKWIWIWILFTWEKICGFGLYLRIMVGFVFVFGFASRGYLNTTALDAIKDMCYA